jgi:hypothetical protein
MGDTPMQGINRLRAAAAILVVTLFSIGCNPLTGAYFLLFGVEDKIPPEFKIAKDSKKSTHVLVLTDLLAESHSDLLGVERQLGNAINRQLEADCKMNKEKIQLIPIHKIEEFKVNNPHWRTMTEIGRQFEVDYVVEVEVANMSLYERDSRKRLFRGRSALRVQVIDVAKSCDEGPVHQRSLTVEYPKARGPIPVDDDMNVERFREVFVQRMAQEVSKQLTAHVSTASLMQD